jgi:hypothetical protein
MCACSWVPRINADGRSAHTWLRFDVDAADLANAKDARGRLAARGTVRGDLRIRF